MARPLRIPGRASYILAALALVASGCHMAPRQEVDECHRLSQTLRSENAGLKDQMLALRSQNQDLSERAVDDARRLAQLETSNERLETSVQAYQDERTRLEAAFKEMRACLPNSLQPLSSNQQGGEEPSRPRGGNELDPVAEPGPRREHDPDIKQADGSAASPGAGARARHGKAARKNDAWLPSRSNGVPDRSSESSPTGPDP
jgi:type II secretory pathway pseudopilin PulG